MPMLRFTAVLSVLLFGACRGDDFIGFADQVDVRVTAGGNGSGSVIAPEPVVGIACQIVDGRETFGGCESSFDDIGAGGTFTLLATESEDSEFVGWTGCTSVSSRICSLSFKQGENPTFRVTATFRKRATPQEGDPGDLLDVNLLHNPSFEDSVGVGSPPTTVGGWRGDVAESVLPVAGVPAIDGSRVLRFLRTGPAVASATGESSQQWQLVDVSALAADIDAGKVRATAKARFASVPGDAQTDRRFDLRVGAFSGVPSEFPASYAAPQGVRLADQVVSVITASTGAWLPAELSFILPPGTRYLAVEIYAFENVFNDATDPEFDGHFADETSLFLRRLP